MLRRVGEAGAGAPQVFVPDGGEDDEADSGEHTRPACWRRRPAVANFGGAVGGGSAWSGGSVAGSAFRRDAGTNTRDACAPRSRSGRLFNNRVHQRAEFLFEPHRRHRLLAVPRRVPVQRGVAALVRHFLQARGHAVAEEDDRRFHQRDLLEEPLPALGRRIEGGAAEAERGVAGEAEVADGEGAVGELLAHPRFQIAVGALAFEEGIAEEEDAVAGEDFKRGVGGAGDGEGEEEDQEGAHGEDDE